MEEGLVDIRERFARDHAAGGVDQNVDPVAEGGLGGGDQAVDRRRVGHVGLVNDRRAARGLDQAQGLLGAGGIIGVVDADLGAFGGKLQRDRAADVAAAAGDDGHLVVQGHGRLVLWNGRD